MGQDSKIEWTDHTFNPWIGCTKVSDGCKFCYAEIDSPARISRAAGNELWGPNAGRKVKAESGWREPLAWDRAAAKAGERHRVFSASQSDVFEDRPDLIEPRARLFRLILATPNLDWLLLTKRPENIGGLWPVGHDLTGPGAAEWPNIWLGTSVENQAMADQRIPDLLKIPAAVRFLSMEPLIEDLGPIDLTGIDWVIVGGESGPKARPMHPDWARSIRDQCVAAGVPFFFKQWGDVMSVLNEDMPEDVYQGIDAAINLSGYGGNPWFRVGKKRAGRMLDGREWSEFPDARTRPEVA
jgi:protein gp37